MGVHAPPRLVVLDAECAHGARLTAVGITRRGNEWVVTGSYDCSHSCERSHRGGAQPVAVVDTEGAVRWPSIN